MFEWLKRRLVAEARDIWRQWSTWLIGAALAIEGATAFFDAGQLLWVLNLAPRQFDEAVPEAVLLALAIVAKLFRQAGLERRREAKVGSRNDG